MRSRLRSLSTGSDARPAPCSTCPLQAGLGPATAGIDNDCDGFIDCFDQGCLGREENTEATCADGLDNDCDDLPDCYDPDCSAFPIGAEVCGDGIDNDCDGQADCADCDCILGAPDYCCPGCMDYPGGFENCCHC